MAGHRRKVSNSTVETVDDSRIRYVPETTVLKPLSLKDPKNEDSNQWPSFLLIDATVYLKDGKRLANPLLPDGPFVVRGKVALDEMDKEQRKHLVNQGVQSGYFCIEIADSVMYAMDYPPVVWISGRSGWFELKPSRQYEEMYSQMCEAITLYYEIRAVFQSYEASVADYRRKPKSERKRIREPTINLDDVLLEYAVAVGDGMYRDEAEERCHKWAPFLINHFPKDDEVTWSGTFFYTWIIDKHPDVYKKYLKRVSNMQREEKAAALKASASSRQSLGTPSRASSEKSHNKSTRSRKQSLDADVDMKDAPAESPRSLSRQPSVKSRVVSKSPVGTPDPLQAKVIQLSPNPVQNPSPAAMDQSTPISDVSALVEVLVDALEEIAGKYNGPLDKIARSAVHSKIYYNFRISNYNAAAEILAYFSNELVPILDAKWHHSPFYEWLVNESRKTTRELLYTTAEKIPSQLIRRTKKQPAAPTAPPTTLSSRLEIRSKLRPPSPDEDSDSDDNHLSTRPRHAGKGGLRLHSAAKKRTATEMLDEDDATPSRQGSKSRKTSHHSPAQGDEDSSSEGASSDAASAAQGDEEEMDDDLLIPPPRDAVRVVVHAEKLPSTSPSGPNGTWVCDQADCGYVVRAAEEAAGKSLIYQHFREHESRTEKAAIAMAEAGRRGGRMPINHLLEKIQSMGQKRMSESREVVNGEIVPLPVKRRLLI